MAENDEALNKTENPEPGNVEDQETADPGSPAGIEHLDFITSLVLMLACVGVIIVAYGDHIKSRKAFYASPGFMPIIIAGSLFLLAVSLMRQSLKNSSVKERVTRVLGAIPRGAGSPRFKNSLIALGFFAVYIFALLRFLPFWLASLILLFVCFVYLKASKLVFCVLISALSIGGIVLLFQIIFHVPMP